MKIYADIRFILNMLDITTRLWYHIYNETRRLRLIHD